MTHSPQSSPKDWLAAHLAKVSDRNETSNLPPSPCWALSCYLGAGEPSQAELDAFNSSANFRRSSVLATYGLLKASGYSPSANEEAVRDGLCRLLERDPFPPDRNAFTYRPIELFGVSLALSDAGSTPSFESKIVGLEDRLKKEYADRPQWERRLVDFSLSQVLSNRSPQKEERLFSEFESLCLDSCIARWTRETPNDERVARCLSEFLKIKIEDLDPSVLPFVESAVRDALCCSVSRLLVTHGSPAQALATLREDYGAAIGRIEAIKQRLTKRCRRLARTLRISCQLSLLGLLTWAIWTCAPRVAHHWGKLEPYTWILSILIPAVAIILNFQSTAKHWWETVEKLLFKIAWKSWMRIIPEIGQPDSHSIEQDARGVAQE